MHILIKDFNGFKTSIEIEETSTIKEIKEKIEQYLNIPKDGHNLILNKTNLDDNKNITEYGINESSILELTLKDNYIKINAVNVMGKIMPFYFKISDTIKDIKNKIEEREGIPQNVQKLVLDPRNQKIVLEDDKKIEDYNIKMDERIHILYNNL